MATQHLLGGIAVLLVEEIRNRENEPWPHCQQVEGVHKGRSLGRTGPAPAGCRGREVAIRKVAALANTPADAVEVLHQTQDRAPLSTKRLDNVGANRLVLDVEAAV